MAYAPPQYPPNFETKPVNFGDSPDDFRNNDYASRSNDTRTERTGYTSGVTVPYSDHLDDQGQTQAQAVASAYTRTQDSRQGSGYTASRQPTGNSTGPPGQDMNRKSAANSLDAMTYIDEDFNYYSSRRKQSDPEDLPTTPLVPNAALPGHTDRRSEFEYAEPRRAKQRDLKRNLLSRILGQDDGLYPVEQRIENKRRGVTRQKRAYATWALTLIMCCVFIYEIVQNYRVTGSPFAFKPTINPMIGPAQIELVTLGARWPPCMKIVQDIPLTLGIACANTTSLPATSVCTIEDICAFGGFGGEEPDQWWRFITPIFLHAGLIHLALNMFGQWFLGGQVEREMGSVAFLILYTSAGIFGNVLGANFALVGIPSVGASGAICGLIGALWVDLFAHWKIDPSPGRKLVGLVVEFLILVGVGFIPTVDNFAHLGGLLMGLLVAIMLYPVISASARHKSIMWSLRAAALVLAIILFVVLIRNFYTGDPAAACSWCRYLSCIPTASNNRCRGTGLTTTQS